MIAPLLRWDHSEDWFVMKFEVRRAANSGERKVKLSLDEQIYIAGHIIDGIIHFFLFSSKKDGRSH